MVTIKEKIYELISRHRGGVSFVELCNEIEEMRGDVVWATANNVVLWCGLSEEGISAIKELAIEKKINSYSDSSSYLCYLVDGKCLTFPLAKRKNHRYKNLRWSPTMFGTYEYVESL